MKLSPTFFAILLGASVSVASICGCAATSTRESTGAYIDNTSLTARVKSALVSDELVRARDVQVESFRGVVQLSGFVDTDAQKDRAKVVTESVTGVKEVKNNLIVKK